MEGQLITRVTISDIAERASLSIGAVSYALNNKPGVSTETRTRVKLIARQMGWTPNQAARSLSRSRADAIGLVLLRPARLLGIEPFYMEFIAGVEAVISSKGIAILLHVLDERAKEIETYEKWWAQRRVDGVLLVDMLQEDPRVEAVRRIGIPAVCVTGDPTAAGDIPSIWTDEGSAMREALHYLIGLGHRRVARVGGVGELVHITMRDNAFLEVAAEAGIENPTIIHTDFSGEAGARATLALLAQQSPPTAIIFDNDVMAVAGLGVAASLGVSVPSRLSLLAWDDSQLCEVTYPALSAMQHDPSTLGSAAAELLLEVIEGKNVQNRESLRPALVTRGSTAAPAGE